MLVKILIVNLKNHLMDNTFTQDLIIQYIYNELSDNQRVEVEQLLNNNFEAREMHDSFVSSIKGLPKIAFNPPQKSIDRILNYSASTQLETLH